MNYLIKYSVYSVEGDLIKEGTIRAKNKQNEFMAKVKFEEYLKMKYPKLDKIIMHSCTQEIDIFKNLGSLFGDILK